MYNWKNIIIFNAVLDKIMIVVLNCFFCNGCQKGALNGDKPHRSQNEHMKKTLNH